MRKSPVADKNINSAVRIHTKVAVNIYSTCDLAKAQLSDCSKPTKTTTLLLVSMSNQPKQEDSLFINHFLNKFVDTRASDSEPLPLNLSYNYVRILRTNILNKYDKQERVNSVVVLAKMVRFLPKSNDIVELFDESFFRELLKIGAQKPCELTGDSVFRVINSLLVGNFIETLTPNTFFGFYAALANNLKIVEYLGPRLLSKNHDTVHLTYEFICYVFYQLPENRTDTACVILEVLRSQKIAKYLEKQLASGEYDNKVHKRLLPIFSKGVAEITKKMQRVKVDLSNPVHKKLVEQILRYIKKYSVGSAINSEQTAFEKSGFTSNPLQYITNNYTLANIYSVKLFLYHNDIEFRRSYYEQVLLTSAEKCFPLARMCFEVNNFLINELFTLFCENPVAYSPYPNIQKFAYDYDTIFAVCMAVSLEFWQSAKGELTTTPEDDDVQAIVGLLKAVFKYIDAKLNPRTSASSELVLLMKSVSYEKAREEQLKQIFRERQQFWGKDVEAFDNRLELEVANFVKEERTLQLIKGSWFYAEDPRFTDKLMSSSSNSSTNSSNHNANGNGTTNNIPTTRHKRVKKYYVCLSPNRQYILFKEFFTKATPFPILEKSNSKTIMLSSVKDIKVTTLNSSSASFASANGELLKTPVSRHINLFVNIRSRNVIQQITIYGRSNEEIVSFYTDTGDLALIWCDGLKLILNRPITSVGSFTKQQIEKLFDVRRAVQFTSMLDHEVRHNKALNNSVATASSDAGAATSATLVNGSSGSNNSTTTSDYDDLDKEITTLQSLGLNDSKEPTTDDDLATIQNIDIATTNGEASDIKRHSKKLLLGKFGIAANASLDDIEDEQLYDYNELISASDGYYYD